MVQVRLLQAGGESSLASTVEHLLVLRVVPGAGDKRAWPHGAPAWWHTWLSFPRSFSRTAEPSQVHNQEGAVSQGSYNWAPFHKRA